MLRKADFVLHLATIFRKYYPDSTPQLFFQAFNLFTELRSFTLDLQLVRDIFPFFDSTISQAVEVFWRYTDHIDLVDEHRAYQLIAEAHRQMQHPALTEMHHHAPVGNLVFWGFSHLSAGQIDLLKALSLHSDVYIPIPREIYALSRPSDWIRWFGTEDFSGEFTPSQLAKLQIVPFAKNRLAETILEFSPRLHAERDYYLAVNNPDSLQLLEIPEGGASYRLPIDLFSEKAALAVDWIRELLKSDRSVESILKSFPMHSKQALEKNDYNYYKVLLLFVQVIREWQELSESNIMLDSFSLAVIDHVVQLNFPRVYAKPLQNDCQTKIGVAGLEALRFHLPSRQPIIIVTSNYSGLRRSNEKYGHEVMQFLSALGPVRRADFDYAWTRFYLLQTLATPNAVLFLENGVAERDLAWDEILQSIEQRETVSLTQKSYQAPKDMLMLNLIDPPLVGRMSASKLQSYLDCPRRYFYQYHQKIALADRAIGTLNPALLGDLQHKVIAAYLSKFSHYESSLLVHVVEEYFETISELVAGLSPIDRQSYAQEVFFFARSAIIFLCRIKDLHPAAQFRFEYSLASHPSTAGSVDCLVLLPEGIMLFDFKRSSASIPSIKEIEEYSALQLWFYFNHLDYAADQYLLFGYINLASMQESLLFAASEELALNFRQDFPDISGVIKVFKDSFVQKFDLYRQVEKEIIEKLCADRTFQPTPIHESVCAFCTLKNICPRSINE